MSQRSTRRDPRVVATFVPPAEAAEICDAVEALVNQLAPRQDLEPCWIACPGYDELVRTGRLAG